MGLESRLDEFLRNHKEILRKGNYFIARKSKVPIRLPVGLTPDLCRILGIMHGDGNMSCKRLLITDRNREYHNYLQTLFGRTFGLKLNVFHDENRNTFYSHSKNTVVYKFLTDVLDLPAGPVRPSILIPRFIRDASVELQSEYIAGVFDSESHIRKRQAEIDFSTTSEELWNFVKTYLRKIGINFSARIRKRRENPEFEIFIYGKGNLSIFNSHVELKHPDKRERINLFLPSLNTPVVLAVNHAHLTLAFLRGMPES